MQNFENEIWKDIKGFEGLYQASNLGRIKSLERIDALGRRVKEKILKPWITHKGYYQVHLHKNSIEKKYLVHRLVWIAFNGQIPEGYEINHLDERPVNNALSNLSLVTHKENINFGTRTEKCSKPVLQFTLDGILVKEYQSIHQAERETGFNQSSIRACCKGKRKTAGGYIWKYAKEVDLIHLFIFLYLSFNFFCLKIVFQVYVPHSANK